MRPSDVESTVPNSMEKLPIPQGFGGLFSFGWCVVITAIGFVAGFNLLNLHGHLDYVDGVNEPTWLLGRLCLLVAWYVCTLALMYNPPTPEHNSLGSELLRNKNIERWQLIGRIRYRFAWVAVASAVAFALSLASHAMLIKGVPGVMQAQYLGIGTSLGMLLCTAAGCFARFLYSASQD